MLICEKLSSQINLLAGLQVDNRVEQGSSGLLQHLPVVASYVAFVQVQAIFLHAAYSGELAEVQGGPELLQVLMPACFLTLRCKQRRQNSYNYR